MDKCQTNALTPLLEQACRKTVRSVAVGKTEPQLRVMNVSQGIHNAFPGGHVHIYWRTASNHNLWNHNLDDASMLTGAIICDVDGQEGRRS